MPGPGEPGALLTEPACHTTRPASSLVCGRGGSVAHREPSFLWTWMRAVASADGPKSATRRHVLLSLALCADPDGSNAYPSVATLATQTALSRMTVMTHLQEAETQGWVRRSNRGLGGQGWARHGYELLIPNAVKQVDRASGEVVKEVDRVGAKGGQPDDGKAVKEVDTTSTETSTEKKHVEFGEEVEAVFELCRTLRADRLGVSDSRLALTKKRASAIRARLRDGFAREELEDAARGFYADEWERRDQYLDPELIYRDDERVRRFRDQHRNGRPRAPVNGRAALEAIERGGRGE